MRIGERSRGSRRGALGLLSVRVRGELRLELALDLRPDLLPVGALREFLVKLAAEVVEAAASASHRGQRTRVEVALA
jgi:hypothetical protein